MLKEIEEIRLESERAIKELRQHIYGLQSNFFMRWDAKATIKKAEIKIEMIQQLLVKLESLSEQINPVVNDLKSIIGIRMVNSRKK